MAMLVTLLASSAVWAENKPEAVVDGLNNGLLNVMQEAKNLGYDGRFKKLAPLLERTYAFGEMARIVSGSYWKSFSDSEKQALVRAFANMSISTYASRFNGFGGERFEIVKSEEIPPPSPGILVHTNLLKANGEAIKLNYRLFLVDGVWRVIDVYYNASISELANQRSQYLSVLSAEGYVGLMKRLENISKDLQSKG